jgi:hypothetical protein
LLVASAISMAGFLMACGTTPSASRTCTQLRLFYRNGSVNLAYTTNPIFLGGVRCFQQGEVQIVRVALDPLRCEFTSSGAFPSSP